ncbi:hypothetical protein WK92_15110 [Burkholderia ubonensis]|uniref:OmpA family protein n=1 Tax=Burkholderia ubonensis TaxID=101571 RepID=UPI000755E968|nr:OmpA family protein [Burkholderia ubonensis]KVW21758.1 hypothetical protein WK92_15110 [Burkholderia ubonensis]KVW47331.1 hypothetical protein WK95_06385 [Burkholderia ubonensis]
MRFDAPRKIGLVLSMAAMLGGCSSASGPTFNAHSVGRANKPQAYQTECTGMLEGPEVCYRKAREICGKEQVRPIQDLAWLGETSGGQRGVHTFVFECGPQEPALAARVAPPPPTPPTPPAAPKKISLSGDAYFDFDKATLTAQARQRLDKLISDAGGMAFGTVMIDGHTDAMGSDAYNLVLSQRRAQAVATYLKEHGLNAQSFVSHGYAKSQPVASNATADGRAQNRRVEITLNPVK